jgi:maltose-binding protein MalE
LKRRFAFLAALVIIVAYLAARSPASPVPVTTPQRTDEPAVTEALALVEPTAEVPTMTITPTGESGTPGSTIKVPDITGTLQGGPTATENPSLAVEGSVTLWNSWDESENASLVDIIAAFQEQYPNVQFDVIYIPKDDLRGRFESAAIAGGGPTVLIAPPEWVPDFYTNGLVSSLSDKANKELLSKIHPVALKAARFQDVLIGIPPTIQGVVLFRNKSIVPNPPVTSSDLIEKAKAATSGEVIGFVLEAGPFFAIPQLAACGGVLMEENGDPAFNNESGVCWLNFIKSFKDAGIPIELNNDNDSDLFKAGRAGMIVDGTWNTNDLAEAIGVDNLAIDPWPITDLGQMSGYVQTELMVLNANASRDDAIAGWKFIEFMLSPEAQALLADPTKAGHIPAISGIDVGDRFVNEAYRALRDGVAYPVTPEIDAYWAPLENAIKSVLEQGKEPGDALEQAEDEVKTGLEEMRNIE